MRPSLIPSEEIMPEHRRIIVGPPEGMPLDGEIRALEMLVHESAGSLPIFRARIVLDDGELERLADGEPFWLSMWGHVVPFDVAMTEPPES